MTDNENEYMSQTELGKIYGVSSHTIGKWLVEVGLRTKEKRPTDESLATSVTIKRPSTQPGTFYYVWHAETVIKAFQEGGHPWVEPKSVLD